MLVMKVTCPYCGKQLRMSKPLGAGHRILCSGCNRSFAPRPADGARVDEAPARPPQALRPAPSRTAVVTAPPVLPAAPPEEEAEPRAVKPWLAVLGLGALVGGLLLLAGGI